jgi:hypothetical protein
MPTDLPYAADAEESLAYDELEVRLTRYSTTALNVAKYVLKSIHADTCLYHPLPLL